VKLMKRGPRPDPSAVTLAALLVMVYLTSAATAPGFAAAAAATGDALARCAAIDASAPRLACYDALAGRTPVTAVAAARPAAAATPAAAMVASGPAPMAASPAAAVAPPVAAAAPAANDPQNFGLAQVQVHTAPEGPKSIEVHVTQVIDNGVTRPSVVLDNGQTWTFTEAADDASLRPGDPVTIKRAALGSFLLVSPAKHSYHVHRTR
jgi:hypothetical protein